MVINQSPLFQATKCRQMLLRIASELDGLVERLKYQADMPEIAAYITLLKIRLNEAEEALGRAILERKGT